MESRCDVIGRGDGAAVFRRTRADWRTPQDERAGLEEQSDAKKVGVVDDVKYLGLERRWSRPTIVRCRSRFAGRLYLIVRDAARRERAAVDPARDRVVARGRRHRSHQHAGAGDRRLDRRSALPHAAGRRVRGRGAAARGDGHLRRDGLLGGAAHARNGPAPRAGRGARGRPAAGARSGGAARRHRHRDRVAGALVRTRWMSTLLFRIKPPISSRSRPSPVRSSASPCSRASARPGARPASTRWSRCGRISERARPRAPRARRETPRVNEVA